MLWRTRAGRPVLIAVGLVAAGVIAGSALTAITGHSILGSTPAQGIAVVYAQSQVQDSFKNGFVPAVQRSAPAVVNVFSERIVRVAGKKRELPSLFNDPFFRQFFGDGFRSGGQSERTPPRDLIEQSLGSGVVVSHDGYILTNAHVVSKAREVRASLATGRQFDVKIIGTDPLTDVAVLKAEVPNLPVIPMGDSSRIDVGDFALAIGNPFGIGQTVTQGIVSATGRHGLGISPYEDFIQTDAAINKGNSGGALTNYAGDLIGLNTAIISPSGGFQGVGFAVPINVARDVMSQIIQHGRVIRGYLGVGIQSVTPQLSKALNLHTEHGALVSDVVAGTPAAKAGLQRGDVITAVNGKPVPDPRELQQIITTTKPGTTVTLQVLRNVRQLTIPVTIAELPPETALAPAPVVPQGGPLQGLSVTEMTPAIAREIGVPPSTPGIVITAVADGTPAAFAGLDKGMVIQEINRQPVRSVAEFRALAQRAGNQPVLLLVNDGGTTRFIVVPPAGQEPLP